MEYKTVTKGECYRFPEGKQCQVMEFATDFQTGEEMVVYKENDKEEKVYVRTLVSFIKEMEKVSDEDMRLIEDFLDIVENEQKLYFLQKHKKDITEKFMNIAAQSMDFAEKETSMEMRYQELLHFIRMKMKYEGGRLH